MISEVSLLSMKANRLCRIGLIVCAGLERLIVLRRGMRRTPPRVYDCLARPAVRSACAISSHASAPGRRSGLRTSPPKSPTCSIANFRLPMPYFAVIIALMGIRRKARARASSSEKRGCPMISSRLQVEAGKDERFDRRGGRRAVGCLAESTRNGDAHSPSSPHLPFPEGHGAVEPPLRNGPLFPLPPPRPTRNCP